MSAKLETRADCSRCAALCCIAYPSDEMPGFSASKAAGQPCPKLGGDGFCTIYERREQEGFSGCIRYECFGAGQHVVQTLFEGRDWREDTKLLGPMVETFLAMRPLSDLAYLVERAQAVVDDETVREELYDLEKELAQIGQSRASLADSNAFEKCQNAISRIYATIDPAKLRKS